MPILSTDLDGTLLDTEHGSVPAKFFHTLEILKSRAILNAKKWQWVVNTGRPFDYLMEAMRQFPVLPDFIITRERDIALLSTLSRHQTGECPSPAYIPHTPWNSLAERLHEELFASHLPRLRHIRDFLLKNTRAQWIEMPPHEPCGIIGSCEDDITLIRPLVDQLCAEIPQLAYQSTGIYLRFCHSRFSKGSALAELCRIAGIHPDETWAIGDGQNDLSAMHPDIARHFACPANSPAEVRHHVARHGGYVCHLPAAMGVCEWLESSSSLTLPGLPG